MFSMTNRLLLLVLIMAVMLGCDRESSENSESSTVTEPSVTETLEQDSPAPEANPPAIGQKAPDFTLTNQRGEEVSLSDALASPVILAFYRGHW